MHASASPQLKVKSCIMINLDTCKLRVLSVSPLLIRIFLFNLTVLWMLSNAEDRWLVLRRQSSHGRTRLEFFRNDRLVNDSEPLFHVQLTNLVEITNRVNGRRTTDVTIIFQRGRHLTFRLKSGKLKQNPNRGDCCLCLICSICFA